MDILGANIHFRC